MWDSTGKHRYTYICRIFSKLRTNAPLTLAQAISKKSKWRNCQCKLGDCLHSSKLRKGGTVGNIGCRFKEHAVVIWFNRVEFSEIDRAGNRRCSSLNRWRLHSSNSVLYIPRNVVKFMYESYPPMIIGRKDNSGTVVTSCTCWNIPTGTALASSTDILQLPTSISFLNKLTKLASCLNPVTCKIFFRPFYLWL